MKKDGIFYKARFLLMAVFLALPVTPASPSVSLKSRHWRPNCHTQKHRFCRDCKREQSRCCCRGPRSHRVRKGATGSTGATGATRCCQELVSLSAPWRGVISRI